MSLFLPSSCHPERRYRAKRSTTKSKDPTPVESSNLSAQEAEGHPWTQISRMIAEPYCAAFTSFQISLYFARRGMSCQK